MRIDKLLAHSGFGSRKDVKDLIKKGHVTVNGQIVKSDKTQINEINDEIFVDQEQIIYEEFVYYMLNKPSGYVSATEDLYYPTVVSLIDDYYGNDLFPVGRLDVDTEGLLLLTNDGQLAHRLTSPKHKCPKTYYADIEGIVTDEDVIAFKKGITIDTGYTCKEAQLRILSNDEQSSSIEVTIYEGKFHQVKKMFQSVDKEVIYLKRLSMGTLQLDDSLQLGQYRRLTQEELDGLS